MKHNVIKLSLLLLLFMMWDSALCHAETRGVRVVAVDRESGEKKEIKLYNKTYAVIIGIDQYNSLPYDKQLSYAVRDAQGVEEVLRNNFKFDRITSLYNRDATKANIMKALSGDLSKISEDDSVFVFWAGHGFTESTRHGDLGYLVPFDGTFEKSELYKNISMTAIKDDISKRIPAKHVFYVMDACYSGLLVTKRGAGRKPERDLAYLQEIAKESVRQVLTAGSKDQEVLDGGPMGHSVFAGRLIELLENTDDFITATEISTMLKERVFSDARARNHTQTPKYGELFGLGDYILIPSIERKVEDTKSKVADLEKEMQRLKQLEVAAIKTEDERAQRRAELERKAVEAKLKAEQLRQETLEAERIRKEQEEAQRLEREQRLAREKQEEETHLAALKQQVMAKRQELGGATLSSLSPEATITEMREVDEKIKAIQASYREELARGIMAIAERIDTQFQKAANEKKDEFESDEEFKARVGKVRLKAGKEQTQEITKLEQKIQEEYDRQVAPFIEQLKRLSGNQFTLTSDKLILELGAYNTEFNTYPVTIKSREPIGRILVAANANIPIPRDEARTFKQHYENNILRPEIKGNFQTTGLFRIAQAYVIDDATNKKYDLFASKFVDLGNGIVYDSVTNLLWTKDGTYFKKKYSSKDAEKTLKGLKVAGLAGWRLPTLSELKRMYTVYHGQEPHPFVNISEIGYNTMYYNHGYLTLDFGTYGTVSLRNRQSAKKADPKGKFEIWPVRGN